MKEQERVSLATDLSGEDHDRAIFVTEVTHILSIWQSRTSKEWQLDPGGAIW